MASVREHNPEVPIVLFSDIIREGSPFDAQYKIEEPKHSAVDKMQNLWKTPFKPTLSIDSDTYITDSLEMVFDTLNVCDVAGVFASGWVPNVNHCAVPAPLWEINTGVLAFGDGAAIREAMKNWHAEHEAINKELLDAGADPWWTTRDQPSFRKMIWNNRDIRVGMMPEEFNFLRQFGSHAWGKAIIIHGRGDMPKLAAEINAHIDNRVYLQGAGTIRHFYNLGLRDSLKQLWGITKAVLYFQYRRMRGG